MQNTNHQMMGYDRAITMFSPDGRLLQVEYAKTTVRKGATVLGICCADGVVLIADKRIVNPLVKPESVEKIFEIDEHIAATAAGIMADARVLIERSQVKAQQHHVTYDSPIDVVTVVKDIASIKQYTTQSGGMRPFGVGTIVAGVDSSGPRLFWTDPTGTYFEYSAVAVGEADSDVEAILQKSVSATMTVDDGLRVGISALKEVLKEKFDISRIEAAVIRVQDKQFHRLSADELGKHN